MNTLRTPNEILTDYDEERQQQLDNVIETISIALEKEFSGQPVSVTLGIGNMAFKKIALQVQSILNLKGWCFSGSRAIDSYQGSYVELVVYPLTKE